MVAVLGISIPSAVGATEAEELRYLAEVLLAKEYGEGGGHVLRWVESPEVVLKTGAAEDKALLRRVVGELNEALRGTEMKLSLVAEATKERRIEVHLMPEARFREVGKTKGFEVPENLDGYVHIFWNTERKFIQRATVMVATDKVSGGMRHHTLLEELTQALGPIGDTTVSPESVMFSKDGDHGKAPKLGELDRRMLRLLYGHLRPGDGGIEVGVAYARHWGREPARGRN
jgi:hypothetical protein